MTPSAAADAARVDVDVVEASKSPSDLKQYRVLTLRNGLQALLISSRDAVAASAAAEDDEHGDARGYDDEDDDEDDDDDMSDDDEPDDDEDDSCSDSTSEHSAFDGDDHEDGGAQRRAGACLSVGVGSFAEPAHLPGLAHYLEHMVFMGSEKYPDENEFEAFLSAHGGFSNGSTDNEMTSYTFEVGPEHLRPALDMFAQFFIAPLLKAEAMERELAAIESEFSQATQSDRTRLQQVLCDTAPTSHPYHRFGWGNFKSLKELPERDGVDVRQEIRAFYDRYYSANLMKLVVCGEDSLEDLAAWVTESFSAIPNHGVERPSFASAGPPFGRGVDHSPSICRVVPVRDIMTVHLDWMLPSIFGKHHCKAADYVACLLGHESEGSVLEHLKARGWILSLTAGVTDTDGYECGTFGAKFDVTMKVTPDGLAHWEDIVAVVFEYLAMLSSSGLPEWVFEENQALADISFRFQQDTSAVENCEDLAQIMQDMFQVEPCEWLRYDLFRGPFDREEIQRTLSALTPDNLRVLLVARAFATEPTFEKEARKDAWFGVQYAVEAVAEDTLHRWNTVETNSALHLPQPNPFVPRNFDLQPLPDDAHDVHEAPQTHDSRFGRLWFKPDTTFRTPRAYVAFFFEIPCLLERVDFLMLTHLFVRLVRDALSARTYQATVAELTYSLQVKQKGIEVLFGGFSDKIATLVEFVIAELFSTKVDAQRFAVLHEEMVRDQRNALVKPWLKARHVQNQLLTRHVFSMDDIIGSVEQATHAQLEEYLVEKLWKSGVQFASFVHGNLSWAAARQLQDLVEKRLSEADAAIFSSFDAPIQQVTVLPASDHAQLLSVWSEHADDVNTRVNMHFQIGPVDLTTLAYLDLLEQLLGEPLFDTLRTKQSLGYDVSCNVSFMHNVLGLNVAVESSLCTTTHIVKCVDAFLDEFAQALIDMPEEHFIAHVHAQILKKREPDHNLYETTQRYWDEIVTHRECFDIDEQVARALEHCTKDQMTAYYRQWVLDEAKKLVVYVKGQASVDAQALAQQATDASSSESTEDIDKLVEIKDLAAFKRGLSYYPNRWLTRERRATSLAMGERTNL